MYIFPSIYLHTHTYKHIYGVNECLAAHIKDEHLPTLTDSFDLCFFFICMPFSRCVDNDCQTAHICRSKSLQRYQKGKCKNYFVNYYYVTFIKTLFILVLFCIRWSIINSFDSLHLHFFIIWSIINDYYSFWKGIYFHLHFDFIFY